MKNRQLIEIIEILSKGSFRADIVVPLLRN